MKKISLLIIIGLLMISLVACGNSSEVTASTTENSTEVTAEYYSNTEIPTFQNITGVACTASLNEDTSVKSSDYVFGCAGYKYNNVSVTDFQNYRDKLDEIGAEETDFSSSSTAILIFYEFNDTTFAIYASIGSEDSFEEVLIAFS